MNKLIICLSAVAMTCVSAKIAHAEGSNDVETCKKQFREEFEKNEPSIERRYHRAVGFVKSKSGKNKLEEFKRNSELESKRIAALLFDEIDNHKTEQHSKAELEKESFDKNTTQKSAIWAARRQVADRTLKRMSSHSGLKWSLEIWDDSATACAQISAPQIGEGMGLEACFTLSRPRPRAGELIQVLPEPPVIRTSLEGRFNMAFDPLDSLESVKEWYGEFLVFEPTKSLQDCGDTLYFANQLSNFDPSRPLTSQTPNNSKVTDASAKSDVVAHVEPTDAGSAQSSPARSR